MSNIIYTAALTDWSITRSGPEVLSMTDHDHKSVEQPTYF